MCWCLIGKAGAVKLWDKIDWRAIWTGIKTVAWA